MRGNVMVATGLVTALALAGCAPLSNLLGSDATPTTPAEFVAGETVTSSDGVVTITLPTGWNDLSVEYFEQTPNSVLAAYWTMGDDLDSPLTPFATVSHSVIRMAGITATDIVADEAASWIGTLGGEITAEGDFVTDAGGTGAWKQVVGEDDGLPTSIHVIVVQEGELFAKAFLETYPVGGNYVGTELVGAATTIDLTAPANDPQGDVADGVYSDGAYLVDVPSGWFQRTDLTDSDIEDFALAQGSSLAGFWFLREPREDSAEAAWLFVERAPGGLAPLERLEDAYGPVGTTSEQSGVVSTVESLEEVTLPGGREGARTCVLLEISELAITARQCFYTFSFEGMLIEASIEGTTLSAEDVLAVETMLASIRHNS